MRLDVGNSWKNKEYNYPKKLKMAMINDEDKESITKYGSFGQLKFTSKVIHYYFIKIE